MSLERFARVLLCAAAAFLPPSSACRAANALTTAPVDYSLYREGEVERIEHRYAGWLLTCDSIRRLGQKFCSLRTVARSADGTIVAAMTVSTDDRGLPAALVTLPYGTSLTTGTRISFALAKPGGDLARVRGDGRRLDPLRCEGIGCQVVWSISPADIRRLRSGQALRLSFQLVRPSPFPRLVVSPPAETVSGTVDATGFSDALDASLH